VLVCPQMAQSVVLVCPQMAQGSQNTKCGVGVSSNGTKCGVGVSSNGTKVTECFVETRSLFPRLKCRRCSQRGQRADVCRKVAVCAASCHVSCKRAF